MSGHDADPAAGAGSGHAGSGQRVRRLQKARGVVPNMFKTLAHTPALALATAGYLKALLSDGALAGWYKELIATRMSVLNGSEYAVSAHALSARQKGASEEQIVAVKGDFEQGPFTQTEKLGLR